MERIEIRIISKAWQDILDGTIIGTCHEDDQNRIDPCEGQSCEQRGLLLA